MPEIRPKSSPWCEARSSRGPSATFPANERLQTLADQRQRLQSLRRGPACAGSPTTNGVMQAAFLVPTPAPSIDQDLAKIERDLRLLDEQEQALRAEVFRDQSPQATAGRPVIAESTASPNAVDRVRITVVGEGQLHFDPGGRQRDHPDDPRDRSARRPGQDRHPRGSVHGDGGWRGSKVFPGRSIDIWGRRGR